ncbi:hypothetical protein TRIP_B250216 [uncultured Desulfatiglans sp.]|nr:hypothetical protein TRIP_B250216 [uncultured Desulfatiglans sp.]
MPDISADLHGWSWDDLQVVSIQALGSLERAGRGPATTRRGRRSASFSDQDFRHYLENL